MCVIKIEWLGSGDFVCGYDECVYGLLLYFVWVNCLKESLMFDVK